MAVDMSPTSVKSLIEINRLQEATSVRALIGMAMSAKAIEHCCYEKGKSLSDEEMKLNDEVHRFAAARLKQMYAQVKDPTLGKYMAKAIVRNI